MPSSGLLISWAMPAARRPTVVSRSAWKSCRSSSRTRASSRARASARSRRSASPAAAAQHQGQGHHRQVQEQRRAVARRQRLHARHRRVLGQRAGQTPGRAATILRRRPRPRRRLGRAGPSCPPEGRRAGHGLPLASGSRQAAGSRPAERRLGSEQAGTAPSPLEGRRRSCPHRTASPRGAGADRGLGRAFAAGGARGDPEHGYAPAASREQQRVAVRSADGEAHHLGMRPQEEEESRLGGLAAERSTFALSRAQPLHGNGSREEREVGAGRGQTALEGARPRVGIALEQPRGLLGRASTRHRDALEPGRIHPRHGEQGEDDEKGRAGPPRARRGEQTGPLGSMRRCRLASRPPKHYTRGSGPPWPRRVLRTWGKSLRNLSPGRRRWMP